MKILKVIIVIAVISIASIIGFFIRNAYLDKQIAILENECLQKQAIAESMLTEINLTDEQSVQDKEFLETMFNEIFTFYDMDGFDNARINAVCYGLPQRFIDRFYDTSELSSSLYAEAMLDVMCKYDSSSLYLLDRDDDTGYYLAKVTLDSVKYNSSFEIAIFVSLAESGDENQRIRAMTYYYIN